MSFAVNILAALAVIVSFVVWGIVAGVIALLVGGIIAIRVATIEQRDHDARNHRR